MLFQVLTGLPRFLDRREEAGLHRYRLNRLPRKLLLNESIWPPDDAIEL